MGWGGKSIGIARGWQLTGTLVVLLAGIGTPLMGRALGISPPLIIIQNMLPVTEQEKIIHLSRGSSDDHGSINISVAVEGDTVHALQIRPVIVIPEGAAGVDYHFRIVVPDKTPSGTYEAHILFSIIPSSEEATGTVARVNVGAKATVRFTVSSLPSVVVQILSVSVDDARFGQPLYLHYTVSNRGNTPWKPEQIEVVFVPRHDSAGGERMVIAGGELLAVSPGAEGVVVALSASPRLESGQYRAVARFYDRGRVIAERTSWVFSILPEHSIFTIPQQMSAALARISVRIVWATLFFIIMISGLLKLLSKRVQ